MAAYRPLRIDNSHLFEHPLQNNDTAESKFGFS